MSTRREVQIEGYSADGQMIVQQAFSTYNWYEQLHPIIDANEERVRQGIAEIRGWQYDSRGDVALHWQTTYYVNGAVKEIKDYHSDGTTIIRKWKEDGSIDNDEVPEQLLLF